MNDDVKPKRAYASGRRKAQADETRQGVVAAARKAFIRQGWQGTTIAEIARTAGVSAETIYARFGSKRALLQAVLQTAARRDRPETPLIEQAGPKAVVAASDQRSAIRLFAEDISQVLASAAPLMAVVRSGSETDPLLADLYKEVQAGRRSNIAVVTEALARTGPLRTGVSPRSALTTVWRLTSPELFLLVTEIEGSTPEDYAQWLGDALIALLLPEAAQE